MGGTTTRYGFSGAPEVAAEEPVSQDVRSNRTIYGHDFHLRPPLPVPEPAAPPPPAPPEPVQPRHPARPPVPGPPASSSSLRLSRPDVCSRRFGSAMRYGPAPKRSGKSRFPALARIFGRWNTEGSFVRSDSPRDRDTLSIPRDKNLRAVAIVGGMALVSFFLVLGLLRTSERAAGPKAPPPAVTAAAPSSSPPVAPSTPPPEPQPATPAAPALGSPSALPSSTLEPWEGSATALTGSPPAASAAAAEALPVRPPAQTATYPRVRTTYPRVVRTTYPGVVRIKKAPLARRAPASDPDSPMPLSF